MATRKPFALVAGKVKQWVTGDKLPYDTLPTGTGSNTVAAGDDARLSDAREWTASTVSQAEAEAGTSTTRRAWTAERVRQAIAAWWNTTSSAFGRTLANVADAAAGRIALELGTAAVANVTTNALDTTVGRLLKVADFGLGGAAQQIADCDMYTYRSGFYLCASSTLHKPIPESGYLLVISSNDNVTSQIYNSYAGSNRTFTRTYYLGTWSAWIEHAGLGRDATFAALTATGNLIASSAARIGSSGTPSFTVGYGLDVTTTGAVTATVRANRGSATTPGSIEMYSGDTTVGFYTNSATKALSYNFNGSEQIKYDPAAKTLAVASNAAAVVSYGLLNGTVSKLRLAEGSNGAASNFVVLDQVPSADVATRRAGVAVYLGYNKSTSIESNKMAAFYGQSDSSYGSYVSARIATGNLDRVIVTWDGHILPGADNTQDIASASARIKDIYLANAPTVSSDQALKTPRRDFLDAELDAIDSCEIGLFQWLDAVADKGDAARLHAGVIAQQVIKAFEDQGLNPYHYGPICRDPIFEDRLVEERPVMRQRQVTRTVTSEDRRIEIIDGIPTEIVEVKQVEEPVFEMRPVVRQDGTPVTQSMPVLQDDGTPLLDEAGQPVTAEQPVLHQCPVMEDYEDIERVTEPVQTGWRYSIRYDELLIMLVADVRRKNERLAERLAALESAQ